MVASRRRLLRSDRRGQLLVIGALLLAALLILLALVLNSAIYAENLATREGPNSVEPVELRSEANATAKTAIADINDENVENGTYPHLEDELDDRMDDWLSSMRQQYALSGRSLRLERTSVTRGWRIKQTNEGRNFTAGGTDGMEGTQTWQVAGNVKQAPIFEQNISRQSLYSAGYGTSEAALANSSYHIAVDEPGTSGFWRVYVFQGVGTQNVYVLTEEPDENFVGNTAAYVNFAAGSCSYQTTDWVEMGVRDGTFGGAPCDELAFFDDLSSGYDIYYNNTAGTDDLGNTVNRSMGTYELFVGEADVDGEPFYKASDGRSPFRQTALYAAEYDLEYEGGSIDYAGQVDATPDRSDVAGKARPTASFSYSYDSSNSEYDVDWSASDSDGDLSEVEVLLYENVTATKIDSETTSVSGGDADGTTSVGAASDGVRYDIYVIATDETGVSKVVKKTDVAG